MKARPVLIIGAGLVGAYLGRSLAVRSIPICIMDAYADPRYLTRIVGREPHIILRHLTAESSSFLDEYRDIVWAARALDTHSRAIPEMLASWAQRVRGARLVFMSSLAVYGGCGDGIDELGPICPHSSYGRFKVQQEEALTEHIKDFECLQIIRATGAVGALKSRRSGRNSAPAIDSALRDYVEGVPPRLFLWHHRDQYLFAGDLADFISDLICSPSRREVRTINVGPGVSHSPQDVALALKCLLNLDIKLDIAHDVDPPSGILSITAAHNLTGFSPLGLEETLRETLADICTLI